MKKKILIGLISLLVITSISYAQTTVFLKSGRKLEGKLIEKTDNYVKIEWEGIPLTYYMEEIDHIESASEMQSPSELESLQAKIEDCYSQAIELGAKQRFKEAQDKFREVLRKTRGIEGMKGIKGYYRNAKGLLDFLEDIGKQKIHSQTATHFFKGLILHRQEKYDEAIEEYKKCLKLNPDCARIHFNLASIYLRKVMWDKAEVEFKKVIEVDSDYTALAYCYLAGIYFNKKEYDLAIFYCDKTQERGTSCAPRLLRALEPYR
ncbi:MAG: tetratricopeptide repeat protein [Candidatus Omnitrophica bacterium]|nr:tetratricopeptide repeat protein [Candidatus Omnitrophota bacterium]